MKRLFYLLFILFCFSSCKDEVKPIVFKTQTIARPYSANISLTYDIALGNSNRSKAINANIEKAIISSLNSTKNKTDLDVVLRDFNIEYVNFKRDFPDESESVWELDIETEKTYQSEAVITIAISTYEFKGGAHGNDKIKFINIDAKTGDLLNREAIIENIDNFKTLAQTHFIKSLEIADENMEMKDFFFGKPFQLPENIGFTEDGLVLLYNVYEVASYDQGYTEFVIPFEEIESYLKVN